jgi:hypothetical protein
MAPPRGAIPSHRRAPDWPAARLGDRRPLPRPAPRRVMGNGVVPHQAAHAVSLLLADLATLTAAEHTDLGRDAA